MVLRDVQPMPVLIVLSAVVFAMVPIARATSSSDFVVQVSATVQTNPAQVTLSWPADPNALSCSLYRKTRDALSWGPEITLAADATNYVDSSVAIGGTCEYQIYRFRLEGESCGYLYAGIEAALVEMRGKVVLLVDKTHSLSLAKELERLQQDLVGDGWTVSRHDVPRMAVDPANGNSGVWAARSNELAKVKALIKADYDADSANVKAVLLFGHVPVPYSGDLYPDGHADHRGAWPADAYYGDMDGSWTDSSALRTRASDPRNHNVPGDGKFDQTLIPSDLELQVGRVDFANMPAFSQGETELLRRYLNKDHNFRHGLVSAERRGLIDEHWGSDTGPAVAANGWRNFTAFFGASKTDTGNWLPTLATQSYLWGYACGAGSYSDCAGVASTAVLATSDPRVVFTMLFGSYFGDWDSPHNLLRAHLGTTNYILTSAWVGRPNWQFHHMGLGETIGFSTRLIQNNNGVNYLSGTFAHFVHIALMGDPTLRMHPVAPASGFMITTNSSDGVDLCWQASPDTVLGYHVYRAATVAGPFTRLNRELIAGTHYTDPLVSMNVYMVRAVKLEVSGSGRYYNASQGIYQNLAADFGPPIQVDEGPSPKLTATDLGNGSFAIGGVGIPGRAYGIQFADSLAGSNWQTLGTAVADPFGIFMFTATNGPRQRFYRSAYP